MNKDQILEAIGNTLTFLESLGYTSGDIHDDLAKAGEALDDLPASTFRQTAQESA